MNTFSKTFKTVILTAGFFGTFSLWATPPDGISFTGTDTLSSDNTIDDPPIPGLARTLTISTPVNEITSLSVSLDISSADGDTAWNGDLYAQLTSPLGTLSVLLNQPGVTGANPGGYGDSGFVITVLDSASNDIHTYQDVSYSLNGGGQLTGSWQSDGRTDPTSSVRDKTLNQMLGQDPNGVWTLFIADQANGNRAKLNSWSIDGIGVTVPEPQFTVLALTTALAGFALWRRLAR